MTIIKNLQNEVALVTGASRGIGRAILKEFVKRGATVIGTATSSASADAISNFLLHNGASRGKGIILNVNDVISCNSIIKEVEAIFGNLSILVNNAGITEDQLAIRMTEKEWNNVISTNLNAVARLSRAVLRNMIKIRYGRIINITSVVSFTGNFGQINYAAAKAGVLGMSRALAREISSRNITVNCIAPGFINTDMTEKLNQKKIACLLQQIPLGRFGTPEDIASAVAFLASQEASYITGTTLHVNGGMYMG